MPGTTDKQKPQGSLEAQSDELKLKVMIKPGLKIPQLQKKKKIVKKIQSKPVKKEFEGDSQADIPVVIKIREDS
jgi:hypothetical protein